MSPPFDPFSDRDDYDELVDLVGPDRDDCGEVDQADRYGVEFCEWCGLAPCRCDDDEPVEADPYLRRALRERHEFAVEKLVSAERVLPAPRPLKIPPPPCCNAGCPNPRKSKSEARCDTCYRYARTHGVERPLERVERAAYRKVGDPDGARVADHKRAVEKLAREWFEDERRAVEAARRYLPDVIADVRRRWWAEIVNNSTFIWWGDREMRKQLFKDVERTLDGLRKGTT